MSPAHKRIVAGLAVSAALLTPVTSAFCDTPSATPLAEHELHLAGKSASAPDTNGNGNVRLDSTIVAGLIRWVRSKTEWHTYTAPVVRFVPEAQLSEMFAARSKGREAVHIDALYSPKEDTVYLPTGWNAGDVHDRATLLHELIHHLQEINKIEVTCPNVYEFQAYSLTIDWLREQGVEEPLKMLNMNDVALFMLSQCPVY